MATDRVLLFSWWCLVVISVLFMLFFRLPNMHGPDAVGIEINAFVIPLIVALVPAIWTDLASRARMPFLKRTIAILAIEAAVYWQLRLS